MTMQRLCHSHVRAALIGTLSLCALSFTLRADSPAHDYPTLARVEYAQECIASHGRKLASLYQCACAIDRIADSLSYDDFVEASTFAKYAGLGGEGGAIFRDSEHARSMAKLYRDTESAALRSCGIN